MTTRIDLDRDLAAWLADAGPAGIRDEAVEDALAAAAIQRQRRWMIPVVGPESWPRGEPASALSILTIGIAVLALTVASLALVASGASRPATPSSGPAPSPVAGKPLLHPIPDAVRGTWLAEQPDGMTFDGRGGQAVLRLVIDPHAIRIEGPTLRDGDLFAATTAGVTDAGTLVLTTGVGREPVMEVAGTVVAACEPGNAGSYTWTAVPAAGGVDRLRLGLVEESCAARAAVMPRTWIRSLLGSDGGTALLPVSSYLVRATLPRGAYTSEGTDSGWSVHTADDRSGIDALVDPRVVLDSCRPLDGQTDTATSTAAFLAALARNPGLQVASRRSISVAGRAGTEIVVRSRDAGACGPTGAFGWQTGTLWSVDPTMTLIAFDLPPHVLVIHVRGEDPGPRETVVRSLDVGDSLP